MNGSHVNTISHHLSLRPPQRESLEILARVCDIIPLEKNGLLLRFPHPSSLRRTAKYASLLRISGPLHLTLFEQPGKDDLFSSLLVDFYVSSAAASIWANSSSSV